MPRARSRAGCGSSTSGSRATSSTASARRRSSRRSRPRPARPPPRHPRRGSPSSRSWPSSRARARTQVDARLPWTSRAERPAMSFAASRGLDWKANRQEGEMTETQSTTAITEVATVIVPVADQDRALEFYVDKLGFEKRTDMPYGDGNRWLEVVPPGAATGIALVPPREGESAGIETRIALRTEDADAIHAELRDGGVEGRGGHADGRPRAADVL